MKIISEIEPKESFVKFLDNQIDYLFRVATIPGWTIWTLAGTLVTILWLLAKDLSAAPVNPYHIGIIFGYLAFMVSLFPLKELRSGNDKAARFIIPREVFYGNQRAWLFYFLKHLLFAVIAFLVFENGFAYFSSILVAYWILAAVFFAAIVFISFFDFPLPKSGDSLAKKEYDGLIRFAGFAVTSLWLIAFYGYTDYLFRQNEFSLGDFKIPILLLIAVYLVEKMMEIDVSVNGGIIKSLVDIRARLILSEMPYVEAYNSVRVILLGYATAEIFKKDFELLRRDLQEILVLQKKIEGGQDLICSELQAPFKDIGREKANVVIEGIKEIRALGLRARAVFKKFRENHEILTTKMKVVGAAGYDVSLYDVQSIEVEKFLEKIESDLSRIEEKGRELADKAKVGQE